MRIPGEGIENGGVVGVATGAGLEEDLPPSSFAFRILVGGGKGCSVVGVLIEPAEGVDFAVDLTVSEELALAEALSPGGLARIIGVLPGMASINRVCYNYLTPVLLHINRQPDTSFDEYFTIALIKTKNTVR